MTRKQIAAILGAIVLAVVAPILTLALLNGLDGKSQAAPAATNFTGPHYKCYGIYDGTGYVGQTVHLEDQFGTQDVVVTYPYDLCAPAVKYQDGIEVGGGSLSDPHFKSYLIWGQDPHQLVNLRSQFGTWENVEVGQAEVLWVPTLKQVVGEDPPEGPLPTEPHYVCYDIWVTDIPTGLDLELETQFGRTPWELSSGIYLCAPALKEGLGNLDAPHLMCHYDTVEDYPQYTVNLQTQFPYEEGLDIGTFEGGWLGCVPVEKEVVGIHYRQYNITGTAPGVTVDIRTQFGLDTDVIVNSTWTLNAPALKNGEGYLDAPHLVEYAITSDEDPDEYVRLTTQFGVHENVEVGKAVSLLVPAAKEVTYPEPVPPGPLESEPHYKCYIVYDDSLTIPAVDLQTQFEIEEGVTVDYLAYLCAPAIKYIGGEAAGGDLSYPHLACYITDYSPDPEHVVNLWTQFDSYTNVDVGDSQWLCVPAEKEIVQRPTFSIEDGGPSTPSGGGLLDPADILYNPGAPAQCIPCANLGLIGCIGNPDVPPYDDLDALTYGADFGTYSSAEGYLGFSVDSGSTGQPGTAVNDETIGGCAAAPGPEADEFTTPLDGTNSQYFDGNGVPCGVNAGMNLGLVEPGPPPDGDDLDAIDNKDCWEIDPDGDQVPNREVYFSLTPGSPSLDPDGIPGTGDELSPADVLVTTVPGVLQVYATEAQLGLGTYGDGDDVNGLCLAETAWPPGVPERLVFDPDPVPPAPRDYLFYTLEKNSPSIGPMKLVPDAATIMWVPAPGVAVPVDLATALGLLDDNTDDVDAIKCVKGLVDISLEQYYITLPEGLTAPPETEVTLTVSTWNDFSMYEEKHYIAVDLTELSPPSVTSQVGWAVLGAIPSQLNVRFNAKAGDICTDEYGAVVPCGEGGVAGLPWNPASLPKPPAADMDSCKDLEDNDGDGLIDFDDPDCVDIYDVHFDIDLDECQTYDVDREVQIHCKVAGEFEVEFENIELPLGADDIDLEGEENNESRIPLTIICEEEITGACCTNVPPCDCTETTAANCQGTYLGDGTLCGGSGACCEVGSDACYDCDVTCCDALVGVSQGAGTVCTAPEACCFTDLCVDLDPLCCASAGGTPQGVTTSCSALEGCCTPGGTCTDCDPICCDDIGGVPQGQGNSCAGNQACCFDDGSCADCDGLCCDDEGGVAQGPGTDCDPNPCEVSGKKWEQLPDLTTWGMDVGSLEGPPLLLANDWECEESEYITEIHIWASWFDDYLPYGAEPGAVDFTLSFHDDVPAPPYSHPGELLKTVTDPAFDVHPYEMVPSEGWFDPYWGWWLPEADWTVWEYIFYLEGEDRFYQQGTEQDPTIYWLDVQATPSDPVALFGWKTAVPPHQIDDAVMDVEPPNGAWVPLTYPWEHLYEGQSLDLAFALYGVAGPAWDRDMDCHWNDFEGVDKETLHGSDPDNPNSTPEVCDGIDNNGDTQVDEGWDMGGEVGTADCFDPEVDTDEDGIYNDVETDDDGDGWTDVEEAWMATDPLDKCPDDTSDQAWPLDMNNDGIAKINDVLYYAGRLKAEYGPPVDPNYSCRLDLNKDMITKINDVLFYAGRLKETCTQGYP